MLIRVMLGRHTAMATITVSVVVVDFDSEPLLAWVPLNLEFLFPRRRFESLRHSNILVQFGVLDARSHLGMVGVLARPLSLVQLQFIEICVWEASRLRCLVRHDDVLRVNGFHILGLVPLLAI